MTGLIIAYYENMSFHDQGFSKEPTRVRSVLDTLMKGISGASLSTIETILAHWPSIIDESLLPFCTPVAVHEKCLTITVTDPGLVQEIQWQSDKILEGVKSLFHEDIITQIKISLRSQKD